MVRGFLKPATRIGKLPGGRTNGGRGSNGRRQTRCAALCRPKMLCLLTVVLPSLLLAAHWRRAVSGAWTQQPPDQAAPTIRCVAWRHTLSCSPYGERVPAGDKACDVPITRAAGYCECSDGWTTHRMTCGYRPPFTCKAACTALNTNRAEALKLPAKMTCSTSGSQTEAAGGLADGHTPNSLPEWATAAELVKERLSGATAGGSRRKLAGSHQMRRRLTSRSVRAEQDQQSEQQSRQQQDQRQQQQQQQQQQRQRESTVQQQRQQQREQQEEQQQSGQQPAERDRAEDGARLLALHRDRERLHGEASSLWQSFSAAVLAAGPHTMDLPGERSNKFDFVKQGLRMRRKDIARARGQWEAFLAAAPEFPADMFSGRGIVILAGRLPYMVPAWINIHMLRRAGCTLPVEMFFPDGEMPTAPLEVALARLGVACRRLSTGSAALSGFTLKAAAVLLSSFEEVLFLDADNVAVRDPTPLFDSAPFAETGALLWPDYWDSSAAPDLPAVLGVAPGDAPRSSFESGQMLFRKSRVWRGLLLAAFMNTQSEFYYRMLSNFMGQGDKETFPFALLATNASFHLITTPVGSVGLNKLHCNKGQSHCWREFAGNTMTQHDLGGKLLFLHANFRPKFSLDLPADFAAYTRRWQVAQPGKAPFVDLMAATGIGPEVDFEQEVYNVLAAMRCASWLPDYVAATKDALPPSNPGFHPLNNGMDFRRPYRWGITGDYLRFTDVTFGDRLKFFSHRWIKPRLQRHRKIGSLNKA